MGVPVQVSPRGVPQLAVSQFLDNAALKPLREKQKLRDDMLARLEAIQTDKFSLQMLLQSLGVDVAALISRLRQASELGHTLPRARRNITTNFVRTQLYGRK